MKYDVVIVGAGLSGLAAGIRLAYFDKAVCVLERHSQIGGLNSFYRRRGRNYDVGLHAVTNWATRQQRSAPLNRLLRQLRLRWDDLQLAPQTESAVVFPDCTLRFSNQFELLSDQVVALFPTVRDRWQRVVAEVNELAGGRPQSLGSARKWLTERLADPLLVEMLLCPVLFYGSPTENDVDLFDFAVLFRSVFLEGLGRPLGGIRQILDTLRRKLSEVGGQLRLKRGVRRILHDGQKAFGVELEDGERVEADAVLSSAGIVETLSLCDADERLRKQFPPGRLSFVETIGWLKEPPSHYGLNFSVLFFNDAPEVTYRCPDEPVELRSGVVCCPANFRYPSPVDDRTIRVTALANPGYWFSLPTGRYAVEKEAWRRRLLERVSEFADRDLNPEVVDFDCFTPRTIHRFTRHVNGAVYGCPRKLRDGTTHLQNLFVCGTDQGYLGIVGSMLSGVTVVNQHLLR